MSGAAHIARLEAFLLEARCPNIGWHANGAERTDKAPRCSWCEARAAALNKGHAPD